MVTAMLLRALLVFALAASAGSGAAQTVRLEVASPRFSRGQAVRASAALTNEGREAAEWTLHAWLHSRDPKAAVPRTFRRSVRVEPGAKATVDFSFATAGWMLGGTYEVRVELVGKGGGVVGRASQVVEIEGLRAMELEVRVCRDEGCKVPAKLFSPGEVVHVSYRTNAPAPQVDALLTTPKGKERLALPARIPVESVGDYRLEVRASQEGYRPAKRVVLFGVVGRPPEVPRME